MAKTCPICNLVNPDTARICDCGHDFALSKTFPWLRTRPSVWPTAVKCALVITACQVALLWLIVGLTAPNTKPLFMYVGFPIVPLLDTQPGQLLLRPIFRLLPGEGAAYVTLTALNVLFWFVLVHTLLRHLARRQTVRSD